MRLLKLAIVNFKPLHRRKPAGQNVEDFGIEPQRGDENCETRGSQHTYARPHEPASLRYGPGNEITDPHELR